LGKIRRDFKLLDIKVQKQKRISTFENWSEALAKKGFEASENIPMLKIWKALEKG
jgi:hypothetical protein